MRVVCVALCARAFMPRSLGNDCIALDSNYAPDGLKRSGPVSGRDDGRLCFTMEPSRDAGRRVISHIISLPFAITLENILVGLYLPFKTRTHTRRSLSRRC